MTTPDDDRFADAFRQSLSTGPDIDADAALSRVTARSRVVRRRRMAVRAGGLLAGAATVLALWLAVRPGDDATIETVDSPSTFGLTSSSAVAATSTTAPSTPTSTASIPAVTGSSVPAATGPTATSNPTAPTIPTSSDPTVPVETTPAPTAPPATSPSIGATTYSGIGGSMTVRVDAGTLVLVGVQPAAGYAITEQKANERDAEVRFESGDARTRIRVRLDDGRLVPEIEDT